MTEREIRITTVGLNGRVELDGTDISNGLYGYVIRHRAGQPPEIELNPLVLELDDGRIHIADDARKLLVQFGWTPPAEPVVTDEEPMRA